MKTEQERIDYLANRIREFNILVSGEGEVRGGFGELPPIGQGDITIDHIEDSFNKFRLTGNKGIQAAGSLKNGYTLFIPQGGGAPGFPPSVSPPPPPPPPPLTCPPTNPCTVDVVLALPTVGTGSLMDKPVSGDGTPDGDGWSAEGWEHITDCGDPCSTCGDPPFADACTTLMRWRWPDLVTRLIFDLDRVSGDSVLEDGWYIDAHAADDIDCGWTTALDGQCVRIGDLDMFDSGDVNVNLDLPAQFDPERCGTANLDLTFHPC